MTADEIKQCREEWQESWKMIGEKTFHDFETHRNYCHVWETKWADALLSHAESGLELPCPDCGPVGKPCPKCQEEIDRI